jgi:hypothetical protein
MRTESLAPATWSVVAVKLTMGACAAASTAPRAIPASIFAIILNSEF